MVKLSKFDELRNKTDKDLVQVIHNALDLGIRHASQALSSADTWEIAERSRGRAHTSYVEVSRLLPLAGEITTGEKRRVESRLDHLKRLLDSLSAIGSTPTPTEDQIAALARSLWEARGRPQGLPEQDWFLAERALKAQKRSHAACV